MNDLMTAWINAENVSLDVVSLGIVKEITLVCDAATVEVSLARTLLISLVLLDQVLAVLAREAGSWAHEWLLFLTLQC